MKSSKCHLEDLILISGLSGSGKSTALNILEDQGYFAIDNLPGVLLPNLLKLLHRGRELGHLNRVALAMDARERDFIRNFGKYAEILKQSRLPYRVVFFDARDDVLVRRYSETRRRHPLAPNERASVGIRKERLLLSPVHTASDHIIDTTYADLRTLRSQVLALADNRLPTKKRQGLAVNLLSFGYRHGLPLEADLVLDVRSLPNPYFVPKLKPLSGRDSKVAQYVLSQKETRAYLKPVRALIRLLLDLSKREGKSYFNIALGCTGGRHRSVAITETLAKDLNRWGYPAKLVHRDLHRDM